MGCCGECGKMKATVWVFWSLNTFFSAIYSGLALASFNAINNGVNSLQVGDSTVTSTYKNSLLASCMLGFFMVLFFCIYSFLVLISRSFGDVKLAYGIMLGTCLHTAWFLLLAALVLQNRDSDMQLLESGGIWSTTDYRTFQATYVFSYILVGMFLLAFLILLFGRTYIGKVDDGATALTSGRNSSSAPVNVYVDMANIPTPKGSMQRNLV